MTKLSLTCGSCLFLEKDKCFTHKCSELGKLTTSKACTSHKANVFQLVGNKAAINRLKNVAVAIRDLKLSEIQALAALLNHERITRKNGWRFYQRVYVRMIGSANSNYLKNFAVGYVVSADKEYVRIVGESGKTMVSALNDKNSTTVYTVDQFKELSRHMVKSRSIEDMSLSRASPVRQLDDFMESEETLNKNVVKSKTRTDDLVAIVAKMTSGIGLKPSRSKKSRSGEIVMDWNK